MTDDTHDSRRPPAMDPVVGAWGLMHEAEDLLLRAGPSPPDATVSEAVAMFERAVDVGGDDPEVVLGANLALAQLEGPRTLDVDTSGLLKAVGHARRARSAAQHLGRPEPAYSSACAALGSIMLRLAGRLSPQERNRTIDETLAVLREAVSSTTALDPKRGGRMANLAQALQTPIPSTEPRDEIIRLDEAVRIYRLLLDDAGAAVSIAEITAAAAHAEQRRCAVLRKLDDVVGAAEAFDLAECMYSKALDLAREQDMPAGGVLMGRSRLKFEAADANGDDRLLDEAIMTGQAALQELRGDLGFEREAMMQLAGQFAARLRRHHGPSDAARADDLSARALNSWYHETGSIEVEWAKNRRLDVLLSVALSQIGTDAHILEVDDLVQGLFLPDERTPQMEAIRAMASIVRVTTAALEATAHDSYVELAELAVQFERVLRSNEFVRDDPVWWVRWFSAHRRISVWAEWIGIDNSIWLPALTDAAQRMQTRLSSLEPMSEVLALGHLQLAEAAMASAILRRNKSEAHRALALLEIPRNRSESLAVSHRIKLGVDGSFLCELLDDAAGASEWIALSLSSLSDLENAEGAPLAARFAVDRERYELAGTAAVLATEPWDLAWIIHSTLHPATTHGDRRAFLSELVECSTSVTVVFLAQSRRRCRAAVLCDGQWTSIDLPDLAIDRVGGAIKAAHHTHAQAQAGPIDARRRWYDARAELNLALANGLVPLSEVLSNQPRPVALRLSGWLHAVPVAPVLLAQTGHSVPIAISLATRKSDIEPPPRRREFVALAEPGDGHRHRYLARVVDDVEAVAAMFDRGEAVVEATVGDLVAALTDARMVLVASHGASANQPDLARLILHDGDLTAAEIVDLDLRGLDLVVVAACEALSIDKVKPEHPFSVQTALIRAGAAASCGPQWVVNDEVASQFTRALFALVAAGNPIAEAYREAWATVHDSSPEFLDMTLVVDSERRLCC